jgi:hypothetical protein
MVGLFGLADLARDLGQGAARHATGRPLSYRLALAGCFPETFALPQRCSNRSAVPVFAKDRGTVHVLVEENAKPRSRQTRVPKKPAAESVKIYFA